MPSMIVKSPAPEFNSSFESMVTAFFEQKRLRVVSNLLSHYEEERFQGDSKCAWFRSKTSMMNKENQCCFLDILNPKDGSTPELIACCGFIKVNLINNNAQLVFICYQEHLENMFSAMHRILAWASSSRYRVATIFCDLAKSRTSPELMSLFSAQGFYELPVEDKKEENTVGILLRYDTTARCQNFTVTTALDHSDANTESGFDEATGHLIETASRKVNETFYESKPSKFSYSKN